MIPTDLYAIIEEFDSYSCKLCKSVRRGYYIYACEECLYMVCVDCASAEYDEYICVACAANWLMREWIGYCGKYECEMCGEQLIPGKCKYCGECGTSFCCRLIYDPAKRCANCRNRKIKSLY